MNKVNHRILVTGGAGMIGSNLVKKLVDLGFEVFVADNLWRGKKEYLFSENSKMVIPDENFYYLDLKDYENCLKVTKNIDIVIHLADVVAGINYVFSNESSLYRSNILINTHTLNASIANKVKKFIYAGTACSYPKSRQSKINPPPFKEEDVFQVLEQTLTCQRNFWNDHSQNYFTVTMQPFPQENGSSFQGTGLTNSFATSVSNNDQTELGQMVYLFNHELMHNWIGHTIHNDNEEEQYWFSEGFTEYYTFKNIAKNKINGLDGTFFIDEFNRTIRDLYASSVTEAPNSEINYDNFWTNYEYSKLPYWRGAIFAFYLDQKIQQMSEGKQSLDDVMYQVYTDASHHPNKDWMM